MFRRLENRYCIAQCTGDRFVNEDSLASFQDGQDLLEMDADDSATRYKQFALSLGDRERDFGQSGTVIIQRQTPVPVTMTLDVTEERTIAELDVTPNINHPNVSELIVELIG